MSRLLGLLLVQLYPSLMRRVRQTCHSARLIPLSDDMGGCQSACFASAFDLNGRMLDPEAAMQLIAHLIERHAHQLQLLEFHDDIKGVRSILAIARERGGSFE